MANILMIYSTVDGQTHRICARLSEALVRAGHQVDIMPVAECSPATLAASGKVVVGASIRYGDYRKELVEFVKRHADELNARPSAFFTVNLVARKPGRDVPERNPYVGKLLDRTRWQPDDIAVFAGRLDYPRIGWRDRQIIRLIMWLTGGPTDTSSTHEFTDWDKVDGFAGRIGRL